MGAPVTYRPATEADRTLSAALARCSFPVASSPKRFARELANQLEVLGEISEAQAAHLRRLVSVYRRQIPAAAVPEAERGLLTDHAAREARAARDATRWTAAPGASVPFWVVRLTGVGTVEAIIARWGEGARFERPSPGGPAPRRAPAPVFDRRAPAPPAADPRQLGMFGEG